MDLIELLKSFNRKERFFLIGQALGNEDFILSEQFRDVLRNKIGIEIPKDAFVAMDYHWDWIYASLYCAQNNTTEFIAENPELKLNSNQEDADLIVAFCRDGVNHLIMIEAKAESGWTNKQFLSKADRLKFIFGIDQNNWQNVKPYFLITSPRKPRDLKIDALPAYLRRSMEDIWFELNVPNNLQKITRCNDNGKADIIGTKWKVEKTTREKI